MPNIVPSADTVPPASVCVCTCVCVCMYVCVCVSVCVCMLMLTTEGYAFQEALISDCLL